MSEKEVPHSVVQQIIMRFLVTKGVKMYEILTRLPNSARTCSQRLRFMAGISYFVKIENESKSSRMSNIGR